MVNYKKGLKEMAHDIDYIQKHGTEADFSRALRVAVQAWNEIIDIKYRVKDRRGP